MTGQPSGEGGQILLRGASPPPTGAGAVTVHRHERQKWEKRNGSKVDAMKHLL